MKFKKGASILFVGLFFFFFMGILYIMSLQIIDRVKFGQDGTMTGQDAQTLTMLKYSSNTQQFFIENYANRFFSEDYSDILMSSNLNKKQHQQKEYITLEENGNQKFKEVKLQHYQLIKEKFNEEFEKILNEKYFPFFQESTEESDITIGRITRTYETIVPEKFVPNITGIKYYLFFEEDKIFGFSYIMQNASNEKASYYQWPHFTINYEDEFENLFKEIIKLRGLVETCLISRSQDECVEGINSDLSFSIIENDTEEDNIKSIELYIEDEPKFFMGFNVTKRTIDHNFDSFT